MKQQILSIGQALSKSEQRTIYGGFGEECEPLLGSCTSDEQCHPVHNGFRAYCEFGCCVTPI
ncbi:hypothetical protein [Kordia sp.]|uniref:hypothetical protein n=1 Tax=Kordia sp. TaxID=1965332 RepID=UPI003D6C67AB